MGFETWVSIAVLLGTGVAICTLMLHGFSKLDTKIDVTRNELGGRIDATRTEFNNEMGGLRIEFKSEMGGLRIEFKNDWNEFRTEVRDDLGKIENRLTAIESRTYDISARLPPIPASASGS